MKSVNLSKRIFLDIHSTSPIISNIKRICKLRHIIKKENPNIVLSFMGPAEDKDASCRAWTPIP